MYRLLLILTLIIASCSPTEQTLPRATGSLEEIIFIVEDMLWETAVKDMVSDVFAKPIEGLNQDEPYYKIVQVNHSEFKSILKTHKQIIIIGKNFTQSNQKNKWAKGQLVVQLNYIGSPADLKQSLNKVKVIFSTNEINTIKRLLYSSSQKKLEQTVRDNFNIDVIIPEEYTAVIDSANIFWATYNPPRKEEIRNILVFSFKAGTKSLQQEVLSHTDRIFKEYLHGANKGSYVKIEPLYPPYFSHNIYRGLWKLENGFMGGPFLLKTYLKDDRIIVAVGVIFAPNSSKRSYVINLEAIL